MSQHASSESARPDPSADTTEDAARLERALFEIKKIIVGQDRTIERLLVSLLAGGHCLLEGVPGLAKTLAVETLATVCGGTYSRIQFTPDLLPADVMGTRIYRASTEQFDTELGPVMANFVLADEVNRAPAKVQSALLEVMAEHQVSIAGVTYPVPEPFLVLATQNPIESEGVYPLPEAQRDRFLLKILLDYPTPAEEVEIVFRMGVEPPVPSQVLDPATIQRLQHAAAHTYCDRAVVDYAVSLVMASRNPTAYALGDIAPYITFGASPRASLGLVAAGRALALMRGRSYTTPQDVYDVAPDVLRHRIVLSYEALAQGLEADQVLTRILSTVPAPRVAPEQDGQLVARAGVPSAPSLPPPPGNGGAPMSATAPTQPVPAGMATPAPWSDRTPSPGAPASTAPPSPDAPAPAWPRPSTSPGRSDGTGPDGSGPAAPE